MGLRSQIKLTALVVMLLVAAAQAQFLGYVAPQTVQQTLGTSVTCTTLTQLFAIQNLGQTQHYLTISNVVGARQFQAVLQSLDPVTLLPGNISDVLETRSGVNGTVRGSGYFPKVQASVICSPNTATFTISYSGAWATTDVVAGSYLTAQIDKTNFFGTTPENVSQVDFFQTPFGSSAGTVFFQYSAAGAGGSFTVTCGGQNFSAAVGTGPTIFTASLANTTAVQPFQIPDTACPNLQLNYLNNGTSGQVTAEYVFATPYGRSTTRYANITTNAGTQVKTGYGYLHTIVVNNPGTTETLTLFDGASCAGTKIGTTSNVTQETLIYDVQFNTGLCITSAGGAAGDFTVSFQ